MFKTFSVDTTNIYLGVLKLHLLQTKNDHLNKTVIYNIYPKKVKVNNNKCNNK